MSGCGRIGLVGSGSWATAIAKIIMENCGALNWFVRSKDAINEFRRLGHNPHYLTMAKFDVEGINTNTSKILNTRFIILIANITTVIRFFFMFLTP